MCGIWTPRRPPACTHACMHVGPASAAGDRDRARARRACQPAPSRRGAAANDGREKGLCSGSPPRPSPGRARPGAGAGAEPAQAVVRVPAAAAGWGDPEGRADASVGQGQGRAWRGSRQAQAHPVQAACMRFPRCRPRGGGQAVMARDSCAVLGLVRRCGGGGRLGARRGAAAAAPPGLPALPLLLAVAWLGGLWGQQLLVASAPRLLVPAAAVPLAP